jgi:hypothetical protein
VKQPAIDSSDAAELAIEEYDSDGNGAVAGGELEQAAGLRSARERLDANRDGGVSADEVAARIEKWKVMGAGIVPLSFTVTLDGQPLAGAVVTFEPEPFLGEEIKSASGTTNANGRGGATIAKEDRPSASTPPGMHLGLYKVKISKIVGGKETIPAKYNEETLLGQEVAQDVSEVINNRVVYALTTK